MTDLTVVDRPFAPGDPVSRADDVLGTLGQVVAVEMVATVRLLGRRGGAEAQADVQRLRPVGGYRDGEWVAHASERWLGRIIGGAFDVRVRLGDGSVCTVQVQSDADGELLEPLEDDDMGACGSVRGRGDIP